MTTSPESSGDLFPELTPPAPAAPRVFSVTELTQTVRLLLEENLRRVWVEGEISNYRRQSSGHQYFTLKDQGSQLSCVLFARPGLWRRAPVSLADGMCVRAQGALTVYEARGQYQLNVQSVQPAGAGLLQAKFEALKQKLEAEGLFDPARKRPLPAFPLRVAIVTSPNGAALRDMLNILTRRSPWVQVLIFPVRVQGEGAGLEVAAALGELNRHAELGLPKPVLIVVTRGGGSTEDLWEFNDETLVRAVFASALPVLSAVGHETDFSLCDFAADLRAPTPSAAAELAAPDRAELLRRLGERAVRLHRCAQAGVRHRAQDLAALTRGGLLREPRLRLDEAAQRLDTAAEALSRSARQRLSRDREKVGALAASLREHRPDQLLALRRQRLAALTLLLPLAAQRGVQEERHHLARLAAQLRLLSPQATLDRGYAMAFGASGLPVRSAREVTDGDRLCLQLADGSVWTRAIPPPP